MSGVKRTEFALRMLKDLPRVSMGNLRPFPTKVNKKRARRGDAGFYGRQSGGQGGRGTLPRIGFEGGQVPFYLRMPMEPYYYGHHLQRQYPPLSLLQLQRLIDLGHIDPDEPIDLTSVCNTKIFQIDTTKRHFGIELTDEGADIFAAKVNIEVQWTSEVTIAAVERNGGTIISKFYDLECVEAMHNPEKFFSKGIAIPRCKLPPQDALKFYSDPKNRGYLADPEEIASARYELSQKFGYELPDISKDPQFDMLTTRKDPRQIWFGIEPGWVVNLTEKQILKPTDEKLKEYYVS